ncbi:alpha/beta-hydrolase [Paraphaeosphaeria sporulosa]|uniref:Alpha/beta-hydrolase n=1 Tax=Paraphaeosphaeria sporulosa TaxID=1460663 RepID=A0A177CR66_9PLEO|nr:alpha/beta-hydrolase [Paraphaeosphaeria sporulosa]OAG09796.1 alpha/beta-hydrolase [Paraphaeosphaeria sporulosa]
MYQVDVPREMDDYTTLPPTAAKDKLKPFNIHIEEHKVQDLKALVRLSPVVQSTYENAAERKEEGHDFGVTREWLIDAKKIWEEEFDWRTHESHLNTFPQYTALITDSDNLPYTIHFCALFSHRTDAIPLARLSGWPCTFAESLPLLSLLREKYTPGTLPYHIILPSQPGWPFSSAPPTERDWTYADSARVLDKLMREVLGFREYAVSGGDIGAGIGRYMAVRHEACKVFHTNHNHMPRPEDVADTPLLLTQDEKEGVARGEDFMAKGTAYGRMAGTRPGTLGAVLAASPLALLAWVGEKYAAWADPRTPVPLGHVLEAVSMYWFTGASATTLYPYREDYLTGVTKKGYLHGQEELYVDKPMGYSFFPKELAPCPRSWAESTGRLMWFRRHEVGGHFPSLERGEALLGDLEDWLGEVWK